MTIQLLLRERGLPTAVRIDDWVRLRLDDTVGHLADRKIVSIERGTDAVLVFPSNFVGTMRAPGVNLTISPKNPEIYETMSLLAAEFNARHADNFIEGPGSGAGDDLSQQFVNALATCLEEGFPWQYTFVTETTTQPRGKIHFQKTVASFISRGVMHKVIAKRTERQQITAFRNVVWLASLYLSISRPGKYSQISQLLVSIDHPSTLDQHSTIEEAKSLMMDIDQWSAAARKLVSISIDLLERANAVGSETVPVSGGSGQFFNLEKMWESVSALLFNSAEIAGCVETVLHGKSKDKVLLLGSGGPQIDPDIVGYRADGTITAIGDAKYKLLKTNSTRWISSDVYQIKCYVDRLLARIGILIYLSEEDSLCVIGRTETGAWLMSAGISIETLTLKRQLAFAWLAEQSGLTDILSDQCAP